MLEWCERQVERLARRVQFRIAVRLHPELNRIENEEDRMWALWFAGADPPTWQRYLGIFCVLLLGPALTTFTTFAIAEAMQMRWRGWWVLMFIGGWLAGFLITAAIIELIRDRGLRSRYFMAMRIFGHDVCQRCGYDMTGHAGDPWTTRTCPECAAAVEPLEEGARRDVLETPATPVRGDRVTEGPEIARRQASKAECAAGRADTPRS